LDIINKSGFWLTGIIILTVLNIGLLAFVWYDHTARDRFPPPNERISHAGDTDDFLAKELDLSQDQIQILRGLNERQVFQSDSIKNEIRQLDSQMVEELFASVPDSIRIRQLSVAIGDKHAEFERKLFNHFLAIKRICNTDQQEKLRQLVTEVLRRSLIPPPPSGPGRDDLRPGPPGDLPPDSYRPIPPFREGEKQLPSGH
jgi:hypothetical protein